MPQSIDNRPLVLVVDDDRTIRLMIRNALENVELRVTEADSGEAALDAFSQLQPKLVLMDVLMPGQDGFETCRQLRALPGGGNVPVLMMTSLNDFDSVHRAFEAGATDFVTKPLNWVMLGYRARYLLRANNAFQELQRSQERLARAQNIARLGHWELDLGTQRFHFSCEVCKFLGLELDKAEPSLDILFQYIHPEDRQLVNNTIHQAIDQHQPYALNYRVTLPDGQERNVYHQGEVVCDETGQAVGMMGTFQDVTELKQAEEKVRHLAFYDNLTGLANRMLFRERLDQALAYCRRHGNALAVLFLDLDRFKRINDTLGHHNGDLLLRKVAERIRHCLRETDCISQLREEEINAFISRLGGDEFSILVTELKHPQDAAKVAERLRAVIARPLDLDGHEVTITASVGISLSPDDGADPDTLLKNADTAMYHAKENGRNTCQFYREAMNASALERLALENDLRKALERQEFLLHFQPQIELQDHRIVGVEALIRWQHPQRGLVNPATFIPLAEETGIIIQINEWVLHAACRIAKAWLDAGCRPLRLAINQSGHLLTLQSIAANVAKALKDTNFPPELLTIEFTESVLMQQGEETIGQLRRLKDLGVRIAIDDFGTGYSSLSYLKSFPIDTLKVDQSFVRDLATEPSDAAITRAIIAMARSLSLNVVGEGIETEAQLRYLRELGCDEIQGFLFSRPLPEADLINLIKKDA